MQTTRREIDSFVARKSFKYNDVIDSKIVNLDIWYHFRLLDESSQKLESNSDSRLISSWVRRLILSNWVESEDWYRVIESSQNVDMKTWLNDQLMSLLQESSEVQILQIRYEFKVDAQFELSDVFNYCLFIL